MDTKEYNLKERLGREAGVAGSEYVEGTSRSMFGLTFTFEPRPTCCPPALSEGSFAELQNRRGVWGRATRFFVAVSTSTIR